jgi:hypothetical protein
VVEVHHDTSLQSMEVEHTVWFADAIDSTAGSGSEKLSL